VGAMKKVYRYTRQIFLADTIKRDRPISILEFDTINEKIRASYKEKTPENFLFSSPEKMKELPSERSAKVEIIVKADSIEDALFRSEKVFEEKMALLTFLSFYPVKFLDSGSISEELTESLETVKLLITEPTNNAPVFNLSTFDGVGLLFNQPDEKITNSLRWFRKGLLDSNPFDRFITLWIAFEMISSKLKPSDKKKFKCPRCNEEIALCPHCNESTETNPMEKDGIINHITNNLKITDNNYYKKLNTMRNDIFHGRFHKVKNKTLKEELAKLKFCLLTAYYQLIHGHLPDYNSNIFQRFQFLMGEHEVNLTMEIKANAIRELQKTSPAENFVEIKNK
jgi:hypothetical protein